MVEFEPLQEKTKQSIQKRQTDKPALDGWLKLFVVMGVISALINLYFFYTFAVIHVGDYAVEAQNSVNAYRFFGLVFNGFLTLLVISCLYFIYIRSRSTRSLVIITLLWALVGAFILYTLSVDAIKATGGDTSQASSGPSSLGAILWLIYWFRSKEVKRIFRY